MKQSFMTFPNFGMLTAEGNTTCTRSISSWISKTCRPIPKSGLQSHPSSVLFATQSSLHTFYNLNQDLLQCHLPLPQPSLHTDLSPQPQTQSQPGLQTSEHPTPLAGHPIAPAGHPTAQVGLPTALGCVQTLGRARRYFAPCCLKSWCAVWTGNQRRHLVCAQYFGECFTSACNLSSQISIAKFSA